MSLWLERIGGDLLQDGELVKKIAKRLRMLHKKSLCGSSNMLNKIASRAYIARADWLNHSYIAHENPKAIRSKVRMTKNV